MMFRALVTLLFLLTFVFISFCQNRLFAQKTIDTLASTAFNGRGYVNNGDNKAAYFLVNEFVNAGLKPLKKNQPNQLSGAQPYLYPFSFPVNTFPGKCVVKIDSKTLIPGKDYIVSPACPTIKGTYALSTLNTANFTTKTKKTALLLDTSYKPSEVEMEAYKNFKVKINLQKKLTWSVSTFQEIHADIDILKTSLSPNAKKISFKIEAKLNNHLANNVIGYVEGTEIKDSFILLTAHYDHLGMMGKTMFPGANDNASGVAMMLDMAHYFSKNPCKYSVAFIAFAGEEAGLIGSKQYTDNPWSELPLGSIKFLINMDLMGSGEKGMAVVNATLFPEYFAKLKHANHDAEKKYLSAFKVRGKAANSDHYWFTERGVKGFFFYLMGDYSHYHDINDNRQNLRLGEFYDKSFLLIRDFINSI